jgi:hypothetical protein
MIAKIAKLKTKKSPLIYTDNTDRKNQKHLPRIVADDCGSEKQDLPRMNTDQDGSGRGLLIGRSKAKTVRQKSEKKGRHRCRPASGGRRRRPTCLFAAFVLRASSCVPAGAAGVPA